MRQEDYGLRGAYPYLCTMWLVIAVDAGKAAAPTAGEKLFPRSMERKQLNQHIELIDCLQLADKGLLITNHPELLCEFGFSSKSAAKKTLKQFQSLRNNLAHTQDISTYDGAQIAYILMRMLE